MNEKTDIERAVEDLKKFMEEHLGRILEGPIKKYINEVLNEREATENEIVRKRSCGKSLTEEYQEYLYLRLRKKTLNVLKAINEGERWANTNIIHNYITCSDEGIRDKYKEMFGGSFIDKPISDLFKEIDEVRPEVEKTISQYITADVEKREKMRNSVHIIAGKPCVIEDFVFDEIDKDDKDISVFSLAAQSIWQYVKTKLDDVLDKSASTDDVTNEMRDNDIRFCRLREKPIDKYVES